MALFTCPFIKLSSEVQTASTLKQGKLDFSNLKAMLPSQSFNHDEMQQSYLPSLEFKPDEEAGGLMQSQVLEMEDGANIYPLGLEWDLYQESCFQNGILSTDDLQSLLEFSMPEETQADKFSSATLSSEESMMSPVCQDFKQEKLLDKLKAFPASSTWLLLLKNYMSGCKRLGGEPEKESKDEMPQPTNANRELSTADIIRVAAFCYIQCAETKDDLRMVIRSVPESSMAGLSEKESKYVQLAYLLLESAEKIGNKQYEPAGNLLEDCRQLSSKDGNPVQRIVYYFAVALQLRIDKETGASSKCENQCEDVDEMMMGPNPAVLACQQRLPISKIKQFTEVQTILEHVASAKRIHLIDLGIRVGMQWSVLMQVLAIRSTCPIELLTITAVGTSEEKIKQTGKRLASFAETLKLPFSFKSVILRDMNDLTEDMFEIETGEAVGIYAALVLRTMISRPECLEHLMQVMRKLDPCIMVVTEVEGNHNSPSFANRFIEAIFFYSSWFDLLDSCMERNDPNRMSMEGDFLSQGIRSIVANEGDERVIRHVGIHLWRSFVRRFGFMETELSLASMHQARLLAELFSSSSCLDICINGKGLTVGSKGTPLVSVSAWKMG
ncbi:hypothetical protein ACLOJK_017629 [Asimina triloba]